MSIRVKLKEKGSNLTRWAKVRGYVPRTVQGVVRRWGHRTDRQPLGGLARQIMADLRKDFDE